MIARLALAMMLSAVSAAAASAQVTSVPFGSNLGASDQPVEITADNLTINEAAGTAVFTGNVRVKQGPLRMGAARIDVFYEESAGGSDGRISRLEAQGQVTVTNGEEAAEADEAVYRVADGVVEMEGDVLLTQGPNALSSGQLTIDLASGRAIFDGRVRTVINPETAP